MKVESSKVFEIWEENWEAFQIFMRLQTQWVRSDGAAIGLNYNSVDFVLKILRVKDRADVFDKLQVMELAAIEFLNKGSK